MGCGKHVSVSPLLFILFFFHSLEQMYVRASVTWDHGSVQAFRLLCEVALFLIWNEKKIVTHETKVILSYVITLRSSTSYKSWSTHWFALFARAPICFRFKPALWRMWAINFNLHLPQPSSNTLSDTPFHLLFCPWKVRIFKAYFTGTFPGIFIKNKT